MWQRIRRAHIVSLRLYHLATEQVAPRIFGIISRPKKPYSPKFLKDRILHQTEIVVSVVIDKLVFTAINLVFILTILSSIRETALVFFPDRSCRPPERAAEWLANVSRTVIGYFE